MLENKDECSYASQHLDLDDTDAFEYDYKRSDVPYGCLYDSSGWLRWYPPNESRYNSGQCGASHYRYRGLKYYCLCRKGEFRHVLRVNLTKILPAIFMKDRVT